MSAQYRPYRDEDNGGDSEPMTWPDHEPTGAVQIYEKTTEDIRVVSHRNLVIGGLGIALLGVLAGLLVGYFAHTEHSGCVRGKSVAIHAVYDADPSIRARLLGLIKAEGINRTAGQLLEVRTDSEIVDLLQQLWKDQGLEAVQQHAYEVLLSFPDSSRPNRMRHFTNASDGAGATVDIFSEEHRPYVAYCTANAPIRGPLVYGGRLQPSDVDWLHGSNVTLDGSILLVRLGTEPLGRQLAMAQRAGARAVLLYPDPREFRPLPSGYPTEQDGSAAWWWLPPDGSHCASPLGPLLGDPQTPGYPAVVSAHRLPRDQVYLPMVPAQTISASVAEILLREEDDVRGSIENPDNHFIFDPLASDDEEAHAVPEAVDAVDVQQHVPRMANTDWCTCGRCRPMDSEQESVCCREVDKVAAHVPEGAKCITSHPGFEPICLNIHALQVAYYTLMEDRPSLVDAPDIHTRYRYTAYRQFVRWIWVRLGRRNRKVLPSCVVNEIRNAFPSERYAGFRYPV